MPEGNENDTNEQWVDLVPIKAVAKIDLAARLREAEHGAKRKEVPATPPPEAPKAAAPPGKVPFAMITAVVLLAVAGVGAGWYLTREKEPPRTAVKPTVTPSRKPSPTPSPRFTPRPTSPPVAAPAPTPPGPAPGTYTVVEGDTLITIGERLGKDWHAIAAANGEIQDPNLIYPGQVLRIP